ncbi:MAG: DNA-directed RNA polymerase subunit omega [Christensenellaceae bacterium]
MINEPAVDVLIRDLGAEEDPVSRYALCVVASKRARQIIEAEKAAAFTILREGTRSFYWRAGILRKARSSSPRTDGL